MEFYIQKEKMSKELSVAQETISTKTFRNILANVVLQSKDNQLCLKATDSNIFLEADIEIESKQDGVLSVYGEKIAQTIRYLPQDELIHVVSNEDGEVIITPEKKDITYRLRTMPPDDFPKVPVILDKQYFVLSQVEFLEMINQVIFAVSTDESRYFLQGTYIESEGKDLTVVATDGRRLSISKKTTSIESSFPGVIVPVKVLRLVKKLCTGEGEIAMLIDGGRIYFKFLNYRISSTLIEGSFPNYQRVVPESQDYRVRVNTKDLNEALRRVSILTEKTHRVEVTIESDVITIKSEESEFGSVKERIQAQGYAGEPITFALNYLYLMDPLTTMTTAETEIMFTDAKKVVTMQEPDNTSKLHVIMPMRV